MILFWLLTAAMLVAALAIIAPALLKQRQQKAFDRNAQNIAIAKERLAELDKELEQGQISADEHASTKLELEQVLLQDLDSATDAPVAVSAFQGKWLLGSLLILLPLVSVLLYQYLGTPSLITAETSTSPAKGHGNAATAGSMAELAIKLRERLEEKTPDDANGWFLLGRTYMTVKDYPEAAHAFEKAYLLLGDQPGVMLALADALTMSQPGTPNDRAAELVEKALALEPENTTALWMAGLNAADRGEYMKALQLMQKLHPLLAGSPQDQQQLEQQITRLSAAAGVEPPALASASAEKATEKSNVVVGGASVKLKISLSPAMQQQAKASDTVFIYAKAMNGPRFPVAAARYQVSDLPLEITLDDSLAVMGDAKLSDFQQVKVGARVSPSGNAIAQSGDLIGERQNIQVGDEAVVEVVIDSIQP